MGKKNELNKVQQQNAEDAHTRNKESTGDPSEEQTEDDKDKIKLALVQNNQQQSFSSSSGSRVHQNITTKTEQSQLSEWYDLPIDRNQNLLTTSP
jgi:hypothetical protein